MIIIKITGGLGNQLFQYAFGKVLEKNFMTSVKYDIKTEVNSNNFTNRNLDIQKFNIDLPKASKNEISNFIYFKEKFFWRVERKIAQNILFFNKSYRVQRNAHEILNELTNNTYYDGYWQCFKYVDEVRDLILDKISTNLSLLEKHKEILNKITNSDSVSIHIRRDDYINIKVNNRLFEICGMDYYNKAIEIVSEKLNNPQFFIFTQDTQWACQNFYGKNIHFVEGNSANEDLLLMSQCKHNIIANSTFSWWGAWLNSNSEKKVVAPKNWYKGNRNKQIANLIPQEWIRV